MRSFEIGFAFFPWGQVRSHSWRVQVELGDAVCEHSPPDFAKQLLSASLQHGALKGAWFQELPVASTAWALCHADVGVLDETTLSVMAVFLVEGSVVSMTAWSDSGALDWD